MERVLDLLREENKSIYYASNEANVPYETLRRCLQNDNSALVKGKAGRKPVLSVQEEEMLVVALEYSAKCGYPQDRDDIAEMIKSFVDTIL